MKKLINYETIAYLIVGVITTIIYFLIRFFVVDLTGNSLLAVFLAQVGAILFAFVTNKIFVFKDKETGFKLVFKQFLTFVVARLFVFGLDLVITYITVTKYSQFFINLLCLKSIPYDSVLFSHTLTKYVIGTPALLNQFIFAMIVQILALVLNYIFSKKKVFKKAN